MPYDEDLAERIRALLTGQPEVREQPMFGGLAFLVGGRMAAVARGGSGLMVRCAPEETEALLDVAGVEPVVMHGRELRGWLCVPAAHDFSEEDLERWVERGVTHARALPAKSAD